MNFEKLQALFVLIFENIFPTIYYFQINLLDRKILRNYLKNIFFGFLFFFSLKRTRGNRYF